MTAADPRVCCAACDVHGDGELCRYQFCECHDGIASMDGGESH